MLPCSPLQTGAAVPGCGRRSSSIFQMNQGSKTDSGFKQAPEFDDESLQPGLVFSHFVLKGLIN